MRSQRNAAKSKTRRQRKEPALLDQLNPDEASLVLQQLLSAHPELLTEAEAIARATLAGVSFESIAVDVQDALRELGLDDLNSRAGSHSWGYTEPSEAAWELLEEAIEPFTTEMQRHLDLGLHAEALEMCQGIILGLYKCRDATEGEVLDWAPDFPEEAATGVFTVWLESRNTSPNSLPLPREFAANHVPEWPWLSKPPA